MAKISASSGKASKAESKTKRAPSIYNLFMKAELAKVKKANSALAQKEAFKVAAGNWKTSKENPASKTYTPRKSDATRDVITPGSVAKLTAAFQQRQVTSGERSDATRDVATPGSVAKLTAAFQQRQVTSGERAAQHTPRRSYATRNGLTPGSVAKLTAAFQQRQVMSDEKAAQQHQPSHLTEGAGHTHSFVPQAEPERSGHALRASVAAGDASTAIARESQRR